MGEPGAVAASLLLLPAETPCRSSRWKEASPDEDRCCLPSTPRTPANCDVPLRAGSILKVTVARQRRGISRSLRMVPFDIINVVRYYAEVIRSFRSRDTERIFHRQVSSKYPQELRRSALRKLLILDAAERIDDLRVPPGNHLEKLTGNRRGQHSIRINDQWRICFRWHQGDAYEVEITYYH